MAFLLCRISQDQSRWAVPLDQITFHQPRDPERAKTHVVVVHYHARGDIAHEVALDQLWVIDKDNLIEAWKSLEERAD